MWCGSLERGKLGFRELARVWLAIPKKGLSCFWKKSPTWALTACHVPTFGVVCAVVFMHGHVACAACETPAFHTSGPLPSACRCILKQLSVHECKDKLTLALSLGNTPESVPAGREGLWPDTHPFPPCCGCLCRWEELGRDLHLSSAHSFCAFIFLFHSCVLLLAGCSGPGCADWADAFLSQAQREPGTAHPPFFKGEAKLSWAIKILTLLSSRAARTWCGICNPLRQDRRREETVPTCKHVAKSPAKAGMPCGPSPARPGPHAAGLRSTASLAPRHTHTGSGFLRLESKSRAWLTILNGTDYFMFPSKLSSRREYFRICAGVTNLSLLWTQPSFPLCCWVFIKNEDR